MVSDTCGNETHQKGLHENKIYNIGSAAKRSVGRGLPDPRGVGGRGRRHTLENILSGSSLDPPFSSSKAGPAAHSLPALDPKSLLHPSREQPRNLHFGQFCRRCEFCWPRSHTLRTTAAELVLLLGGCLQSDPGIHVPLFVLLLTLCTWL